MMLKPMNRASRLGFYGGLLGVSIVIFFWGVFVFSVAYEGPSYSGNLILSIIIECIPAVLGIVSVLVPSYRPLFIGILLLIGASLGFYLMTIAWLAPGIMMLIGAYRSVKAISKPETLLETHNADMRLAKGCIAILTVLGLLILLVGNAIGPRVGVVFPVPTVKP